MKKVSERRKHCALAVVRAEPKIFTPPQTPFLGEWDGQNLISWRLSLPSPTNPFWWRSMHTILSYHGNRPTKIHKQTRRQDQLQYTAPQLASKQCNYGRILVTSRLRDLHVGLAVSAPRRTWQIHRGVCLESRFVTVVSWSHSTHLWSQLTATVRPGSIATRTRPRAWTKLRSPRGKLIS